MIFPIVLDQHPTGDYRYNSSAFYPANNGLLGNGGAAQNDYFTVELRAWSAYDQCGSQFIELRGGDGLWLYINDKLAIDLGGTQTGAAQLVDLDRLGLTHGEILDLRIFYANRNGSGSSFAIRTNLLLVDSLFGSTVLAPRD